MEDLNKVDNLTLNDVFKHLEKVTTEGTRVYFRLEFTGNVSNGISLGCLDDYAVADRFKYNDKFYLKHSQITHDVVVGMINYIDYHKKGVVRGAIAPKKETTSKVNDTLLMAHKYGGVEAVNAFMLSGLNK